MFHILKCFGIFEEGDFPSLVDGEGVSQEQAIAGLMDALAKYRDEVKALAGQDAKALFKLSDELRDDVLPFLGIRLEDKGKGQPSLWKYEDSKVLIQERETKLAEKAKKEAEKAARKELELKKKSTSGKDWFRTMEAEKYSKFDDETGLPTHDASGKALSEAIVNKLRKQQNSQENKYQKWLKEQEASKATEEQKAE